MMKDPVIVHRWRDLLEANPDEKPRFELLRRGALMRRSGIVKTAR